LHASPEWTDQFLEENPDDVLQRLLVAFWQATGAQPRKPIYAAGHRWRYATTLKPLEDCCLFDAERRMGACGDWCSGPRVEGAFLSGMAMAGRVLAQVEALA
jgi:predicted NAD/FAD-dependent oxidoreductase